MTEREQTIRDAFDAQQLAQAAEAALALYGEEILSFLCARVRDQADAREVFSMFAEDMWTGLPNFEWRCTVRTWLYTVARNAMTRFVSAPQRRQARNLSISDMQGVSLLMDRLRSATNVFQQTAVKDRFRLLREQLSDDDQTLLILRVDRALPFRDVAIAMNGNANLDEDSIAREVVRLRKAFERVKSDLREMAEREGLIKRDD